MARRALGPATLTAVRAVERSLTPDDASLLVACSGGADSLALAVAARQVADRRSLPLRAAVVDHALQPGSAEVADTTVSLLKRIRVPAEVIRVAVGSDGRGPEAAARDARSAALRAAATSAGATILLGHTLDDQAETVLLGLARGSGPRSLAGMAVRADSLVRPFLCLRRTITAAVCAEAELTPWSDPQNADPAYARVRVRRAVLPVLEAELGPGVAEALARTAALARADADLLDRLAVEADPGTDTLDVAAVAGLPDAVRRRVLRRWLGRGGARELTATATAEVDALLTGWHGQGPLDLPGVRVARQDGLLWCRRG